MNIKLRNKTNNELVYEFTTDNIKIINDDFNFNIKISISRDVFDFLNENNYTVSFEQTQHIFDGNLSDKDILIQLDKSKLFFLNFPFISMDDEMLDKFYSMSIFNHLTMAEKELNKISYVEKHQKIKNTSLFIEDKEVNIDLTIMNDKIIFVN
jgi:hypothetical protein